MTGALVADLGLATDGSAMAADWPVIAPADLSLSQPRIDPNADAEVLLWDDVRAFLDLFREAERQPDIFVKR
jgi:hypothetical protein